jgi:hypothetical protein
MATTIGYDTTDHFCIFCKCGTPMKITDVGFDYSDGKRKRCKELFRCVTLYCKCDECGNVDQRKIYTDGTCAEFCLRGRS